MVYAQKMRKMTEQRREKKRRTGKSDRIKVMR